MSRSLTFRLPALILIMAAALLAAAPAVEAAQWRTAWTDGGIEHAVTIMINDDTPTDDALPVAVYLANLDVPRIGTDSDQQIQADLLDGQMLVVVLDSSNIPTASPDGEETLRRFFQSLPERVADATDETVEIDSHFVYFLPEGYRLERDLSFWDIQKHAAHGTMQSIMTVYNDLAEKRGLEPAQSPEQIRGPDGQPIHYDLRMDIIYPSGEDAVRVPTVACFASLSRRPRSFSSRDQRLIYPIGFVTSGYAIALIDHPYIPLKRHEYFGHSYPFSLESTSGVASASAAIRYLRAHAEQFNLNGRIGAIGISKASPSVARLADPRHPEQAETQTFEGFPPGSPESQPWPGYDSTISVAFAAMGGGTRRTYQFNEHMVPILIAAGRGDTAGEWLRFPRLVRTCLEQDVHFLAFWMQDVGHNYPHGTDLATGQDRYLLFRRFFDQNLHPHDRQDLKVLYVIPQPDARDVALDGTVRVLPPDDMLPAETIAPRISGDFDGPFDPVEDLRHIPHRSPVAVAFARSIDPHTVTADALTLRHAATGQPVPGRWRAVRQNSRFEFTPNEPLQPGTDYTITVTTDLADTDGRTLSDEFTATFRTTPAPAPGHGHGRP